LNEWQQAHIQRLHREERLAKYEQVLALLKQGLTRRAIADRVDVGPTTVQNWRLAGTFPERKPRQQANQLDRYRSYVQNRWSEGYHNLMGIYRDLQAQGYRGSYAQKELRTQETETRSATEHQKRRVQKLSSGGENIPIAQLARFRVSEGA
jgi:Helix-turn-helix domain of resolvase